MEDAGSENNKTIYKGNLVRSLTAGSNSWARLFGLTTFELINTLACHRDLSEEGQKMLLYDFLGIMVEAITSLMTTAGGSLASSQEECSVSLPYHFLVTLS